MVRLAISLVILVILTGCNLAQTSNVAAVPTATSFRMPQTTLIPTLDRVFQPVARTASPRDSVTPTPETSALSVGCALTDPAPLPLHTVDAKLDYATRQIVARQSIRYVNDTGDTLPDLVLNIEPSRWLEVFTLQGVLQKDTSQGSISPAFDFTGRRLYIELSDPLEVGCTTEIELLYQINVPPVRTGVDAFKGYFGYTARQINLGHWLPTIAQRMGGEWITRQAMFVGEQEVIGKADWDVTLKVENAPAELVIAAPGTAEELAPNQWRYTFKNARDFSLSIGDGFNVSRANAENGAVIEVYSFDDASIYTATGVIDAANHALNVALRSFESYVKLFGPYPYERLLVVQGDFPDGMEFSAMVFVSTDWFKSYEDNPASYLTLITVHEVAHQWWYARVGNDPANTPWLDESLSTYSEYIFIEEYYPHLKDWWWQFRVEAHSPQGFVDSTIYEFSSIRQYINAVYLRGVSMLHALRDDLGTEAFFDVLARYSEQFNGKVASATDFWSLLTPEQLQRSQRTREVFLRRPQVVGQ